MGHSNASMAGQSELWSTTCGEILMSGVIGNSARQSVGKSGDHLLRNAPSCGGSGTLFLGPTQVHFPNGISQIGSAVFTGLAVATDRQTDRPRTRYSVCSVRPHLTNAMRPKNCPTEQNLPSEKYVNSLDCCNVVHAHWIIVYAGQWLLKFYLLTLHDLSRSPILLLKLGPSEHCYAPGCSLTPVASACSLFCCQSLVNILCSATLDQSWTKKCWSVRTVKPCVKCSSALTWKKLTKVN